MKGILEAGAMKIPLNDKARKYLREKKGDVGHNDSDSIPLRSSREFSRGSPVFLSAALSKNLSL